MAHQRGSVVVRERSKQTKVVQVQFWVGRFYFLTRKTSLPVEKNCKCFENGNDSVFTKRTVAVPKSRISTIQLEWYVYVLITQMTSLKWFHSNSAQMILRVNHTTRALNTLLNVQHTRNDTTTTQHNTTHRLLSGKLRSFIQICKQVEQRALIGNLPVGT